MTDKHPPLRRFRVTTSFVLAASIAFLTTARAGRIEYASYISAAVTKNNQLVIAAGDITGAWAVAWPIPRK